MSNLIRRITELPPDLMYKGKVLIDITKVLDVIRDEERESHRVLQDGRMEELSGGLHEVSGSIVRSLSAKGHLLTRKDSSPQNIPDT